MIKFNLDRGPSGLTLKRKILYVICLAYFVAGWSVYHTPDVSLDLIRQADPSIVAHTDLFTLNQIGLIFMITTVVSAAIVAFYSRCDWSYGIMTFLLTWWSLLYILSAIQTGYWQSLYGFVNYGLTAMVLILCSKIVDTPEGMDQSLHTPLPFEQAIREEK